MSLKLFYNNNIETALLLFLSSSFSISMSWSFSLLFLRHDRYVHVLFLSLFVVFFSSSVLFCHLPFSSSFLPIQFVYSLLNSIYVSSSQIMENSRSCQIQVVITCSSLLCLIFFFLSPALKAVWTQIRTPTSNIKTEQSKQLLFLLYFINSPPIKTFPPLLLRHFSLTQFFLLFLAVASSYKNRPINWCHCILDPFNFSSFLFKNTACIHFLYKNTNLFSIQSSSYIIKTQINSKMRSFYPLSNHTAHLLFSLSS